MSLWQRLSTDASHAASDVYSHWILGDDTGKSVLVPLVYHPESPFSSSMLLTTADTTNTTHTPIATGPTTTAATTTTPARLPLGLVFVEINGRAYVQTVAPGSAADRAGIAPHDAVQLAVAVRRPSARHQHPQSHGTQHHHHPRHHRHGDPSSPSARTTATTARSSSSSDEPILTGTTLEENVRRATAYAYHLEKQGARTSYDQLYHLMSTQVWPSAPIEHGNHQHQHQHHPTNKNNNNSTGTGTSVHSQWMAQHFSSPCVEPPPPLPLSPPMVSTTTTTTASSSSSPLKSTPASRRRQRHQTRMKSWNRPSIPPISCWNIFHDQQQQQQQRTAADNTHQGLDQEFLETQPSSDSSSDTTSTALHSPTTTTPTQPRPVALIFRRTRQRQSGGAAASSDSLCLLPTAFRLDDECDAACRLVQRLAPTADMEAPVPDTWEELVHDGTDWLLGPHSMLPPKHPLTEQQSSPSSTTLPLMSGPLMAGGGGGGDSVNRATGPTGNDRIVTPTHRTSASDTSNEHHIPLDDFEQVRVQKLAVLRARMTAETMGVDRTDDVEAATVRAMIQKAVGLAFVRASKVVLGVSMHGGSGIVLSRLSDGTWSAPSSIGMWGLGFGIQFGLEVAEYIFILQTPEAMQHFRRGGSYTVGGNMGVAVGGLGREAYGAASVGGSNICGNDTTTTNHNDDDYNDNNEYESHQGGDVEHSREPESSLGIAPIVAYAKSQGLYVGVSLEGSRIFTRNDINCRTYKFAVGRNVTANDILSGKVPTPPEAEELYAALHSVEFTHEMSCLPRPPEVLRKISANAWTFDRSIQLSSPATSPRTQQPFDLFSKLSQREAEECDAFEAQFKNFMYGGVSVQRLLTDTEGHADRTGKERRTLWLMLPEIGSLRLGFVSKLSDGEGAVSNKSSTLRARRDDPSRLSMGLDADVGTVGSEDLTLDSALPTRDGSTIAPMRRGNVQLSDKHSAALTDVTVLSQEPLVPIKFKGDDKTQHLRVISIQDVSGASLLFLANNFREAELLVCGLKLLLERESARLGVRGGLPISTLDGRSNDGGIARGFRENSASESYPARTTRHSFREFDTSLGGEGDDKSSLLGVDVVDDSQKKWSKWGKQPSRDYMRGQASWVEKDENEETESKFLKFAHGQPVTKTIAKHVQLPLPLPLCRVLLLDSTSPVVKRWQNERGDKKFDESRWSFPSSTPRELERHSSEHQLIASGSMLGAHRTVSFERLRKGSIIRLSEEYTVEADDPKKVVITISEKNPRRGFSAIVRIVLRACNECTCDASVLGELKPVGKDMSNQAAVHKAFVLVLDEIIERYGMDDFGLLAGFVSVVDEMSSGHTRADNSNRDSTTRHPNGGDPQIEEKKTDHHTTFSNTESGFVSFEDMLKTGRESPEVPIKDRPEVASLRKKGVDANLEKRVTTKALPLSDPGEFVAPDGQLPPLMEKKKDAVLIEVKPLPKIRLSLMPSPREEDEDENSSSGLPVPSKPNKKKRSSSSKSASKQSKSMFSDGEKDRRS